MNKPEVKNPNPPKPEVKSFAQSEEKPRKLSTEEMARQIKKMQERDSEMVTGIFKNLENQATAGAKGSVCFGFKKYPNEDFKFYELWDNERYTIPRSVAHHLNNDCYFKEYQQLKGVPEQQDVRTAYDPNGRMHAQHMQASKKIHRYAFHSLEFMDDDPDMAPVDIVEVTVSP